MFNFVVSLFLGMLPEVLFYTLFIVFTKDIREKYLKLFMFISVGYIALIMICRYELLFYLLYIVYVYFVLKLLYKSHIMDIFIFTISVIYLMLCSFVCYYLIDNYLIAMLVDRLLLFVPLFIINYRLNDFYNLYKLKWNRHNDVKGIKSLTLRNISVLTLNIFIVMAYVTLIIVFMKYLNTV